VGNNQLAFNSMPIAARGRHFARVPSVFDENRHFACRPVPSTKLWSPVTGQVLSTNRAC